MNAKQIQGDIFGGLTAGIVALPLALAFGAASGLGAAAGLYGAIAVGFFAAIFGGTATQVSGPTGPMTVVSATVVAGFLEINKPELIFTTFTLAGIFLMLLSFLRVGGYIRYIPYPVVSGFMTGIGAIIILLQIKPLLGLVGSSKVLEGLTSLPTAIPQANLQAIFLSILTIALIYIVPRFQKIVPATLVALLVGTLISVFMKFDLPTIGNIPTGLPKIYLPSFSLEYASAVIIPAITLAALGAIDSLLTSVVADKMTRTKHNSNRELFGQGLGNALGGIIGGIPGSGATMRTVVNINSGGTTRISGATHSLVLLMVLLVLAPFAKVIPMAVLAGILITVGIGIIDYRSFKDITHIPKADAAVLITVLSMTVFVDLLQAVVVGVVMASLLVTKRMGDLTTKSTLEKVKSINWGEKGTVITKRLEGPLTFAFSDSFETMMADLLEMDNLAAITLDMRNVPHIDQSIFYSIEAIAIRLMEKELPFCIVTTNPQPIALIKECHPKVIDKIILKESIAQVIEHLEGVFGAACPDDLRKSSALA